MIKEVAGDILLTKAKVLTHGVAPNDNFATGLALALREQWPACTRTSGIIHRLSIPKPAACGPGPGSAEHHCEFIYFGTRCGLWGQAGRTIASKHYVN